MQLRLRTAVLLAAVLLTASVVAQEAPTASERWLEKHRNPHQKTYFGEPISLSLRNADLVEVLRSFAEIGRFNLIIQPSVKGRVTVELKDVPWDQALEQILKINNLGMDITTGKVQVGPSSSSRTHSFTDAMVTVRLQPKYADAAVVARALASPSTGVPSPGGEIRAEGKSLVIRDVRAVLRDYGRVLTYIDIPSAANEDAASLAKRCVELWQKVLAKPAG